MKNRLIDADEVKNSLLTELLMGVDGGTDASYLKTYEVIGRIEKIINEWVDNQPTVKAIPIEWIKNWFNPTKYANTVYYSLLRDLIKDWEKENEIDRRR